MFRLIDSSVEKTKAYSSIHIIELDVRLISGFLHINETGTSICGGQVLSQWHWVSKMLPWGINLPSTSLSSFLGEASFLSCNVLSPLINKKHKMVRVLISLKESKWCRPCCSKDSFSGSYHNDPQCGYLSSLLLQFSSLDCKSIYLTFLLATGMAQSLHPLHMDRLYIKPSTWRVSGPTGEPVVRDSRHIEPTVSSNMVLANTWWILTVFTSLACTRASCVAVGCRPRSAYYQQRPLS